MADLTTRSPFQDLLPVPVGEMTLAEVAPPHIASVSPYRGSLAACSAALSSVYGISLPKPNRSTSKGGVRCLWSGLNQAFLITPEAPDEAIGAHAALTDQSDAWAVMRLSGKGAEDVLARLTPLDLRPHVFKRGHVARSELSHMMALFARVSAGTEIMVMRSFAGTAVHDLTEAMRSVEARRQLGGD